MAKSHWMKAEPRGCPLIDLVCFYLDDAAQKVIKNKGAPGIDGITYEQLPNLLRVHGEKIRQKLKNGTYIPAPVRRVDIPKPNGGHTDVRNSNSLGPNNPTGHSDDHWRRVRGSILGQKLWVQRGTELPAGSAKSSKVHRRWK